MKLNFKEISTRATKAAGLVAGVAASRMVGTAIEKTGKVKPVMNAGIRLLAGAALPMLAGKKKGGIIEDISNGMIAEAATALATAFKIPGLAGTDTDVSLAGYEEFDSSLAGNDGL